MKLLVRSSVQATEAGMALLFEARAVLFRHNEARQRMAQFASEGAGIIRLGVPLELAADVLPRALAKFAKDRPAARVLARHLSTSAQLAALRSGEIDAILAVRETLGVLVAAEVARNSSAPWGFDSTRSAGCSWSCFPALPARPGMTNSHPFCAATA